MYHGLRCCILGHLRHISSYGAINVCSFLREHIRGIFMLLRENSCLWTINSTNFYKRLIFHLFVHTATTILCTLLSYVAVCRVESVLRGGYIAINICRFRFECVRKMTFPTTALTYEVSDCLHLRCLAVLCCGGYYL